MMLLTAAAFSQLQITKNKVMGEAAFNYIMSTVTVAGEDYDYAQMGFKVPGVDYQLEAKPNEMFKLYLYAGLAYDMSKYTVDGDAPANGDCYASDLSFYLNPMVKGYFQNNLFAKLALPYNYNSVTDQNEDADAIAITNMDMILSGGFDNREIEMHALTPWDKFEKGMAFYGFYDMGMMATYDGDDADELASYFGVAGYYAHMMDNMMVKPYLVFKMGMNDKIDENKYFNIGLDFAKDFNEQMNVEANLDFGMCMLPDEDAAGEDTYNTLSVDARMNYYVMPELDVYAGLGTLMDLTTEDANPYYGIEIGAIYTMNLLKK